MCVDWLVRVLCATVDRTCLVGSPCGIGDDDVLDVPLPRSVCVCMCVCVYVSVCVDKKLELAHISHVCVHVCVYAQCVRVCIRVCMW